MSTGKLLFVAPRNRTLASFLQESREHGWPSFRDKEVRALTLTLTRTLNLNLRRARPNLNPTPDPP